MKRLPKRHPSKPLTVSLARLSSAAAVTAALVVASAVAKDLWWDADGVAAGNDTATGGLLGGTGVWDAATPLWFDPTAPGADVPWPNTTPNNADRAIFTGAAGIVSLGAPAINVNAIEFQVGGYTIDDGGVAVRALVLDGLTPTVTVTNAFDTATISATVAGSSLTKAGAGTLVLSGANTYSGATAVNAGTLSISSSGNLGDGSATNTVTLGGGTLLNTGSGVDLGAARTVTVTAASTIDTAASSDLTISGPLSSTAGSTLTKTGGGTLTLSGTTANATAGLFSVANGLVVLNKTGVNAIGAGGLQIRSNGGTATVRLDAPNQIDDTAAVSLDANVSGQGAVLNLNDQAETVGSLSLRTVTNAGAVIQTGVNGVLTLNGDIDFNNARSADNSAGTRYLLITGTGTVATAAPGGTLDLGNATRTIMVRYTGAPGFENGADATIETAIQNGGIIKAGARTLHLRGANTFAGGITVNDGLVSFTADNHLGDAANVLTANGGGFSFAGTGTYDPTSNRVFNIGANGGTLHTVVAGTAGKIFLNDANQIAGAGTLTKAGPGVLQISAANTSFTGPVTIAGGFIEVQNDQALGATKPVVTLTGGELVRTNGTWDGAIVANSGAISGNTGNSTFSGSINVAGSVSANLRDFNATANARTLTLSGPLTGSGALTATGTASGTAVGTLVLSGNNSGFSGQINAGTRALVTFTNPGARGTGVLNLAGGTIRAGFVNNTVAAVGAPGLNAFYYNFGSNPNATTNPQQYAVDQLFLQPRVFTQVASQVNLPNTTQGSFPTSPVPGFGLGAGTGGINDGVMWKGLLNITAAGTYDFSSAVDDNDILYIDGVQVGAHAAHTAGLTTALGSITLSAGAHSIVYKQTQGTGGGYAVLRYSGADTGGSAAIVGSVAGSVTTGSLAPVDLGALSFTASGTLDLTSPATASSLALGNGTLTVTSPTIDNVTIAGGTITAATPTLAPTTGGLIFTGAIGDGGLGFGLNHAGPYFTEFQGANSYSGLTTVTGGQLRLNSAGGPSIGTGGLTVNAANANGDVANVRLLRANQIADTAAVTMTSGILDLGAVNETIGSLSMSGGRIIGTGTLTVDNLGGASITGGSIFANLAGANGLFIDAGANTVTLGGQNTYTGLTTINSGTLRLVGGTLGAGGAGNGTTVAQGAQLLASGNMSLGAEDIALNAANGLRVLNGRVSTTGTLAFGAGVTDAALRVDRGGELVVGGPIGLGGSATINKTGEGALIFTNNNATLPAVTLSGGALGFSGPQSFGAATVPAGMAFQFNSDPGAGVNVTAPAGTRVIAGYATDNALLSRLNAASAGALVLTADNANALNFSATPNVSLGANGLVTYSGALTAGANGIRLGGGTGKLTVASSLAGSGGVTIGAGDVQLLQANTFTGDVTIGAGGRLVLTNDAQLGAASNAIVLNGGTLQTINVAPTTFGSSHLRVSRNVSIGAAGGTIDVPLGVIAAFNVTNYLGGTGTLTKIGFGEYQNVVSSNFAGNIVVGPNGGSFQVRAGGQLTSAAGITVNTASTLTVDDNNSVGIFTSPRIADRVADAIPITLAGGTLFYNAKNVAGSTSETFGTVTLARGQETISTPVNGQGSDVTIQNLVHQKGSVVRFNSVQSGTTTNTTFGATGNNSRVILSQVNGAAPNAPLIGGWATIFGTEFAQHTASGIAVASYTTQGAATFTPTAAQIINLNAAATATLDDAAGNAHQMLALRFGNNAAQTLAFTDAADTLHIGSGGVLTDGNSQARAIGASAGQGFLTAGPAGVTTAQELFLLNNSNTLTINSTVIDNNAAAPVAVVKALDGQVTLAAANSYSGGTFVNRGTLQANVAGGLGTGDVLVKNARLNLNAPGALGSATATYAVEDNGEIFLQNNAASFTTASDRFSIPAGSTLIGQTNGTGGGMASLTRVSGAPVNGGEVQLAPGAILGHNTTNNGETGTGARTVQNLGTNADLFFGLSNEFNAGAQQFVTVGNGTPWMGLSTDRTSRQWSQGTIFANSDFTLQGLARDGSYAVLTLGKEGSAGSYSIVNQAGVPINAFVTGTLALNEDTPVSLPGDLTFVVTAGALMQPNRTSSLGSDVNPANNAKIRVQAGGTLDPGNFVVVGALAGQPAGVPYPVPGPLNGFVTIEGGGRLLLNDASGVGTGPVGGIAMQAGSILEIGHVNTFTGANGGLINAGQFVFDSTIVRPTVDNVFRLGQFASGSVILQAYSSNRTFTNAFNPFITSGVTIEAQDITLTDGGGIINDSVSRTVNEGRGRILIDGDVTFAATSGTDLNITEGWDLQPNATVTIGSSGIDGNPKRGTVRLTGQISNTGNATNTVTVSGEGSQLAFSQVNVFPDRTRLNLADAVTTFSGNRNVDGSSLRMEQANFGEFIGALTGNGAVMAHNTATGNPAANFTLLAGHGTTSDFTFGGVFKNTNGQNPALIKVGPSQMTLTNTSDSTGFLGVYQGELVLGGANGRWTGGELRLGKSGTLTFDNSVVALADRQAAGTGNRWLTTAGGGEFKLLGHATQAADVQLFGLATSGGTGFSGISTGNSGGFGKVTVVPAAGTTALTTSLTIGQMENFQNAGERNAAWLLRGPGLGGLPGSYNADGIYTPNAANPVDGLVFLTTPNFTAFAGSFAQNGTAQGFIVGAPGTPVVPVRGDLLGATSLTATTGDFVTTDIATAGNRQALRVLAASEYAPYLRANQTTGLNVRATGAMTADGDTRFQVLKMENGSSLTIGGTLPNTEQPSQLMLNGGGLLIPAGATADVTATGDNILRTGAGVSLYVHAFGDVNFSGSVFSDTGLVKTGAGTATFAAGSLDALRGRLVIHEGTVELNDSLANVRNTAQGGAVGFDGPHLELTGGTLDLNGNSQFFNRLESGTLLTGAGIEGGTLTSSTAATVTVQTSSTFSGHIAGAIALNKVGNNTLTLTNTNPATGALTVRQGTIVLRDEGTLSNVSSVDLNYGRIDADSSYLAAVNNRINPAATVNMRGGDFVLRGQAGELVQQSFATVNMLQGQNLFQGFAGASGASVITFGNLVRSPGATVSFQQNSGFLGAAGDTTTAIRYLVNNLNGAPVSLTNKIIGGWAIANNDHFATYDPVRGVSYLSNTTDGFANYDSTDLSTATAASGALNYNDGTSRTIAAGAVVNAIRHAPGAGQTMTLAGQLTINSGGLLTNANQTITYTGAGGSITSGTSELNLFAQQGTTNINVPITGNIAVTRAGSATLNLGAANSYTGATYINGGSNGASTPSGTTNLNVTGANGTTVVAIPGDLHIHQTTVQESQTNQIAQTANVTLYGGAILNLHNSAATETLNSITFLHASGDNTNRAIIGRSAAQAGFLNLTGATPIVVDNTNPTSTPTISSAIGTVNFTRPGGGAQTLQINAPTGTNGLAAVGLLFNSNIGTVPTGIAEGGLIKTGTGMMIVNGVATDQFGNPATTTEVFNIQAGSVRVDDPNALGPVTAVTTVQNGAALYLNDGGSITGSIRLKNGSRMGATITGSVLGSIGSTGFVDVPTGAAVQVDAFDSFIPLSNNGNITVHHQLTGGGTINLVGVQNAVGIGGGGGFFSLRNTANSFNGTISVDTNAVLEAFSNTGATGNTLGTATIALDGGMLRVRDDFGGTYGNNIRLNADSFLDVDRQGTSSSNQTISFGTLTVAAGTHVLNTPYGTGAPIAGNGYRAAFAQVDGPGTLVKGGTRFVDLLSYAPTFSGNIEIAGPQGMSLSQSGNLNFAAATNNLANLTVRGFQNLSGTAVNVSSVLEVGNNAGTVTNGVNGVATGSTTGSLALDGSALLTAGTLRNNGIIGASGSPASITTTTIQGGGRYQTVGQPLSLTGNLANNGATPTTLKVAGNSTVTLTAGNSTSTGGVEVQSGTLRVVSNAAGVTPLGSGTVRVLGIPASSLGAGSQAVAANSGTLQLDATAGAITHSGAIQNSGTLQVSGGATTVAGMISGSAGGYVPGLLEGRFTGTSGDATNFAANRGANPGQFGIVLEPRMGQMNVVTQNPLTGWSDNEMWVYTGEFYDADGVFTFAENIDDQVLVSIDGETRLLNNTGTDQYRTVTSTATNKGQRLTTFDTTNVNTGVAATDFGNPDTDNNPATGTGGWHTIEIRLRNGTGGAGPLVGNGWSANFGFGLNTAGTSVLDGAAFERPIDPGDGSLFRTAVGGKGDVQVDGGASLSAVGLSLTDEVRLNNSAALSLTGAVASDADRITVTGGTPAAPSVLRVGAGGTLTAQSLVATGGSVGSSRVDLQACKLEYSIVSPK